MGRLGNSCHKSVPWNADQSEREAEYLSARRQVVKDLHWGERYKIAKKRFQLISNRRRREEKDLSIDFKRHVEKWRTETMHLSVLTRRLLHPSYLHIISLGRPVLPLLLDEIKERPDHWLVALNAITEEDPAPEGATFTDAIRAWIDWGCRSGLSD